LFVICAKKKVSKGFKWCQKVLKSNPQVQNSVKKVLKIDTKCPKLQRQKSNIIVPRKVAKNWSKWVKLGQSWSKNGPNWCK
jgi:hypothetical protein